MELKFGMVVAERNPYLILRALTDEACRLVGDEHFFQEMLVFIFYGYPPYPFVLISKVRSKLINSDLI